MDNRPGLQATILMEWGERGAAAICPGADYAVIVDVVNRYRSTAPGVAADSLT